MKYSIYWTWNDGTEDSTIVYSAGERDRNIKDMLSRGEFKAIAYCKIYNSGEYGRRTIIL